MRKEELAKEMDPEKIKAGNSKLSNSRQLTILLGYNLMSPFDVI